mmetsp:Transcript_15463/g.25278  ORF Transcript_15463/g.25278 Transcript_15463/m.25278 type:complete len:80 (-) Transcript_15463:1278-1517(-)
MYAALTTAPALAIFFDDILPQSALWHQPKKFNDPVAEKQKRSMRANAGVTATVNVLENGCSLGFFWVWSKFASLAQTPV